MVGLGQHSVQLHQIDGTKTVEMLVGIAEQEYERLDLHDRDRAGRVAAERDTDPLVRTMDCRLADAMSIHAFSAFREYASVVSVCLECFFDLLPA